MTAASTATKLLNDNRTVVGGKDDAGARIAVLPTLPNGLAFVAKTGDRATDAAGSEVVANASVPAYISSADVEFVTVPIDFATTAPDGSSKYIRRQFFKSVVGDPSTGKWCYTNIKGQPLDANGVPTTVASAVNAATTPLSALGQAVTNYVQPGPLPGTYQVSERQQGYSPYIGWTVKQVAQNGV
jgi:hypothetical protein